MSPKVTRFAPSPSGIGLHTGGARTALFNYLAAKSTDGKFVLRIDDTDLSRNTKESEDAIFDAMDWLGLAPDEVWKQSNRLGMYINAAAKMVVSGAARVIDGGAIALIMPADLPTTWNDTIMGDVRITDSDRKLIDGLILIRSDGAPTYHFASMFDDCDMGITNVIRGSDHANNTPKQIAIMHGFARAGLFAGALPDIAFTHLGLIMIKDEDGKKVKLSKRDAAASLMHFRDDGVSAAAMIQFLLRLGWSASDPNFEKTHKIVTLDDAVNLFGEGRMGNSPVMFDAAKLDHLSRLHYRAFEASR
jgi:glutamyl-tRNA synthetase